MINFKSNVVNVKDWLIVILPLDISKQLPSRGMVMVKGFINGLDITIPLEPDGSGSHWFKIDQCLESTLNTNIGDVLDISIEPIKDWYEPEVPDDIITAIRDNGVEHLWDSVTTKARWEWIRWIRSTNNPNTRSKRINEACSKLNSGKRRPCCFDQTRCTEGYVSKGGVLYIDN